jgi:hypothetical protein
MGEGTGKMYAETDLMVLQSKIRTQIETILQAVSVTFLY